MVYLIHFSKKYKHAGHYVGYTTDINARLAAHKKGNGARLMRVVTEAGIDWELVRVWEDGDQKFERSLKKKGNISRKCPICQENKRLEKEKKL